MMSILFVGAGPSCLVVARELAEKGYKCTVIDKRNHIGGNMYDEVNEYGIRVHKYGPHLFHTNKEEVFNWLSKFTDWIDYEHKVKAMLCSGKLVPFPINKETKEFVEEKDLVNVFLRPYTEKMWGIKMNELDKSVINRVKTRDDYEDRYFTNEKHQCMPLLGYTKMFENIIKHKNIKIILDAPFGKSMEKDFDYIFNSMPIDEYYNYCFGELPYRSIKFTDIYFPVPKLLQVTTVNFTHKGPQTRMTEWKNIPHHGSNDEMTTITYEEPCGYKENNNERYYPVKDVNGENNKKYEQYKKIENNKMTFVGRLGKYAYFNMDEIIEDSLIISNNFIKKYE